MWGTCCKPAGRGQGGTIKVQVDLLCGIFIGRSWEAGSSGRHVLSWLAELRICVEECVCVCNERAAEPARCRLCRA